VVGEVQVPKSPKGEASGEVAAGVRQQGKTNPLRVTSQPAGPARAARLCTTVLDSDRAVASRGSPAATRAEGRYLTYLTEKRGSGRDPQQRRRRENPTQEC
jgi:hypothetical protein